MTPASDQASGRRFLLLNWRDGGHPQAGGAEVYTEAVATRLARAGAEVTFFTAAYGSAAPVEERDGYTVVRAGGTLGVYLHAALYLLRHRNDFDVVIDFQNGIPFFAPLFAGRRTAVVLLVHHVHQAQFRLHFPWPASAVGRVLEGPVSRLVYGHRPLVAVSPSTRREMRRQLRLKGPVHVVPNGLTPVTADVVRRPTVEPRIVVVSRLVSHKRFHLLVEAVAALRGRWPGLQVDIAGDGPERGDLERLVRSRGLQDHVRLHGFVTAETRDRLLSQAWLTVSPSANEGWGLTVVEANAVGVPAVAFAVPGLQDSIVDGVTGWLVPPGSDIADGIHRALGDLQDPETAAAFAARARAWAAHFSWDVTTDRLAAIGLAETDRLRAQPHSRRTPSDLATRVDLTVRPGGLTDVGAVRATLRRSDRLLPADGQVHVVLHGCDEAGAEAMLSRLDGDVGVARIALATPSELIVGVLP